MNNRIVYSNQIFTTSSEGEKRVFGYGEIHSEDFLNLRKKFFASGNTEETLRFPAVSKIIPDSKNIPIKKYKPRNYQIKSIQALIGEKNNRYTGIMKAPTGSGKGSIIGFLIAIKNVPTLIIVPTSDLVVQTANRIRDILDVEEDIVGEMGEEKVNLDAPIIVSTWQSLNVKKNFEKIRNRGFGMLICDEVHKAGADVLGRIISSLAIPIKYGMSATPYRTYEETMDKAKKLLGDIVYSVDIEFLYKKNFLLRPSVSFIETDVSASIESGIKYYFEYQLANNEKMRYVYAKKLFQDPIIKKTIPSDATIDNIVHSTEKKYLNKMARMAAKEYIEKVDGDDQENEENNAFSKKIGLAKQGLELSSSRMKLAFDRAINMFSKENECGIILFHTKKPGEILCDMLKKHGYENVFILNGSTENKGEIIKDLGSGKIRNYIAISTVSLLSEGNDIPSLSNLLLCAPPYPPFVDIGRLEQITGRVVRPDPENSSKAPKIEILDDATDGWIETKKNIAYENLLREFHPTILQDQSSIESLLSRDSATTKIQKRIL